MAISVKGIGICDTSVQSGYNLSNVDIELNWGGGYISPASSNTDWTLPEGKTACTITATKDHYTQSGTYYGELVRGYQCPVCGGWVTSRDSDNGCPVCGEPYDSSAANVPTFIVSGGTNNGWKSDSQGGKIVLNRVNDNKVMTYGQLKDTLSGMGYTTNFLNDRTKGVGNTSAFKSNVANNLSTYPITIYNGTYANNKEYLHKNSFIPTEVPFAEPYYIRVISGKTHNITSSAQTINSVIRTNIPSPYNFVSASSVNWITNVRYFEDLHYPDSTLIKVIANVSENNSFTDDRSGVITISNSTYGVSGAIIVNQSAKTVPSEYTIDIDQNSDGTFQGDTSDTVTVYGGTGNTVITGYTAGSFFGADSIQINNISPSTLAPQGEDGTNFRIEFDFSTYLTSHQSDSINITCDQAREGGVYIDANTGGGVLYFDNVLDDASIKIAIECFVNIVN